MEEYETLLHGLRIAATMGIFLLICRGDSNLVVQQVIKTFDTKDPNMVPYCGVVRKLEGKLDGIELHHVKRTDNVVANNLARMGVAREPIPTETFQEVLHKPSVRLQEITKETPTSGGPEGPNLGTIPTYSHH